MSGFQQVKVPIQTNRVTPTFVCAIENIAMDFVVGLPRTVKGNSMILVIIGSGFQVSIFCPKKTVDKWAYLYCANSQTTWSVCLNFLRQGSSFYFQYFEGLQKALGTKLVKGLNHVAEASDRV